MAWSRRDFIATAVAGSVSSLALGQNCRQRPSKPGQAPDHHFARGMDMTTLSGLRFPERRRRHAGSGAKSGEGPEDDPTKAAWD